MTMNELIAKALSGQKVTDEEWHAANVAELEARVHRYVEHLRDLDNPDCKPCGGMLCSCNPAFRRMANR
jgi:hypothetical protein